MRGGESAGRPRRTPVRRRERPTLANEADGAVSAARAQLSDLAQRRPSPKLALVVLPPLPAMSKRRRLTRLTTPPAQLRQRLVPRPPAHRRLQRRLEPVPIERLVAIERLGARLVA